MVEEKAETKERETYSVHINQYSRVPHMNVTQLLVLLLKKTIKVKLKYNMSYFVEHIFIFIILQFH